MTGVNKAIIIGHLGANPEVRVTQAGQSIASFSVATSESWRDKATGEKKERTEWHRVVIFNEALAKIAEQYLKKGSKVYVEGAMRTRKWTDSQAIERYTTEIVLQGFGSAITLLDRRERDPGAGDESAYGPGQAAPAPAIDDEIPL